MSKTKTILITGSGSGIGKAVALALAQRGHRVIATTHRQQQADELIQLAQTQKLALESWVLDVTLPSDRAKVLNNDIDVLINNAAIGETGSLAEIEFSKVRQSFEVNLFGPFELAQLVLKNMIARDTGTVIFISSLLGRVTSPFFGPYSMTKFATSCGAETLRSELAELGSQVQVTVIEPGAYATGFNQKMMASKFAWMGASSYFAKVLESLRHRELARFSKVEEKNLASIVAKIVTAAEAERPLLRYSAPWWQELGVRLMRIAGW